MEGEDEQRDGLERDIDAEALSGLSKNVAVTETVAVVLVVVRSEDMMT